MTATLRIDFEDGTCKDIPLGSSVIEIDVSPDRKQSIAINQIPKGEFRMSFTRPLVDGKKFKAITITKA